MSETGLLHNQVEQWNSIKRDYICFEEKMDVSKGLYEQYLDETLDDYNIQNENKQYLFNLFDEYKELKNKIEETIYSPQNDEETICIKSLDLHIEETEVIKQKICQSEEELRKLNEKYAQIKKSKENEKKIKEQENRSKILAIQTENVMTKYKIFAKVDINQSQLINSLIQSNDNNCSDNIMLNKYYTHELLTGIQISERLLFDNREMFEQLNTEKPWYDILFTCLLDDCLNLDNNLEKYPVQLKQNLSHLNNSLVELYKSILRKRKTSKCPISEKTNNCVFLNNLDDFKIIYSNYIRLICISLTEQEINFAMKQFAIEWVKGSQVINILINSSTSKMATIVLPQFYPLTGTNRIKLIKLTGKEDKEIENFTIAENSGSLTEWITTFTELYNTNSII